jgi:hypothetical protein
MVLRNRTLPEASSYLKKPGFSILDALLAGIGETRFLVYGSTGFPAFIHA